MPTEKFSDFTLKTTPLTGDYLVGYDSTAEYRTTLSNIIASILPSVIAQTSSVPTGTIITHATSTAPSGFLACDGASYSRTGTYANLYSVIGTTYGSGTGTFNVPDLRGYFVRGWDNSGSGVDVIDGTYSQSGTTVTITTNTPHGLSAGNSVAITYRTGTGVSGTFTVLNNAFLTSTTFQYTAVGSQTASGNAVLTGRNRIFGTREGDANKSHIHTGVAASAGNHAHTVYGQRITVQGGSGATVWWGQGSSQNWGTTTNGAHTHALTIDSAGQSDETRPKNIALLYCIKY